MRKLLFGFALLSFAPSSAAVAAEKFTHSYWVRGEYAGATQTTRTRRVRQGRSVQRRVVRQRATRTATRKRIDPRLSPAIAREPVAQIAHTVIETGEQIVKTPFGVATKIIGSTRGIPSEISSFLQRVQGSCGGVKVVSGYRPGARIPSGRQSCHALGQAVDYQVTNPSCALAMARGTSLGHSTDYHSAPGGKHFHVSSCAQERGVKFAHGGGKATRYARSRNTRMARHVVQRRVVQRRATEYSAARRWN